MINVSKPKIKKAVKAKRRSRKNIVSSADRPRMVVFRSNKYLYVQVMDDVSKNVICSVSSISKDMKSEKLTNNIASATVIGKEIAKKLKEKKIKTIVFDRNGYRYHGKIKALAESCRSEGINF